MNSVEIGHTVRNARTAKGMSQEDLADRIGCGQSTIGRIEKGDFKRMPSELPKIFQVLGLPMPDLDGRQVADPGAIIPGAHLMGARDFPIYASAEGGPGEIIRSTDPIDYVPRPAPVAHVRNAYGMIVSGDSMVPEFRPGDTALVNPSMPLIGGECYVLYREVDGEARATIKFLRRWTATEWHLSQWNPPPGRKIEFTLSRKEWAECHRVLGKYARP